MYHNDQQEQAASKTTQIIFRCLKELKQLTQPPSTVRRRNNKSHSSKNSEPLPQQKHTLTSPSQNTAEVQTELGLSSQSVLQKGSSSCSLSSKDNNHNSSQSINASSKLDSDNSVIRFTRTKRAFKQTNNFYMHQNKYDSETSSENYEQISGQYSSSTSSTCKVHKSQQQQQQRNYHSKVLDQSGQFEKLEDSLSNVKSTSQVSINSQNIVIDAQNGVQDQKKQKVNQNHIQEYLQKRLLCPKNNFKCIREKKQDLVESQTSCSVRQISNVSQYEQIKIDKQNGFSNSRESQYYSNDKESSSYQSESQNQIQIQSHKELHLLQQTKQDHKNISRDSMHQSNPILKKSIKKDPLKQPVVVDKQKRNLNVPNQNQNCFLTIHKTQKQSHRFSIQGNMSAREDKKDFVSCQNQQQKQQKATANLQERKYYLQNPEIENYVGNEYQAVIPDIIPGYCPRLYKQQYDHSKVGIKEFDKLMLYLHQTFGKHINQEEASKIIIEANYDIDQVYQTLETGKEEYEYYFALQKRLISQKKGQIKRLKTLKNKRRNILTL
ncbi:hypothetical protein ABPG72_022213 [Tetrahymena utriculariae]